jgi:calcineurin-like phosphoesterase family protein
MEQVLRAGCPVVSTGGHEVAPRRLGLRLLIALIATLLWLVVLGGAAQAATPLRTIVEDVPGSTAYRYAVRDSMGNSMDALKIVRSPFGRYLGVYHTVVNGRFVVKVATSVDLLNWRFAANLAYDASQPTIYPLRWGEVLVAYESHVGCPGGKRCIALRHYRTESALLSGAASRSVILPRTLSTCAEGTPNIYSATPTLSQVEIGLHYFRDCQVDRQARGMLSNFDPATWAPYATPSVDDGILAAGADPGGMIGDRDGGSYDGAYNRLIEAQLAPGDFSSWRNFLYVGGVATQLSIQTHKGSQAFANPTFTPLLLPTGEPGVVVTQFLPSSVAAPGEAGELIYYRPQNPPPPVTLAAAGDIACANKVCHDDETSNLLVNDTPTKVLTLGDNQYEHGDLVNFEKYYVSDWGRLRSITMPTPGNHDPVSSGYTAYFGKPPNYSFDLGAWHLIALDSNDVPGATAFLDSDLAQNPGSRCVLAYWHHPRFSSDVTHGNNVSMDPLWTRLYAAGADVVLNGHAHVYERFAKQTPTGAASETGIREFVVGTGGKALHSFGTVRANSEVRLGGIYGVLRMTLDATSYDWRMQAEDGTTQDSGSDTCS